jgi:hypothetical protein
MKTTLIRMAAAAIFCIPLIAAAQMTPGMYEYTMKMNMPGAPAMPGQTFQRCLTAKDVEGSKGFEMPPGPGSDCKIKDLVQNGGKFSYKMSCSKPQKLDGAVQGTIIPGGMTMDMTMNMEGMPGPMTQAIAAKRISDCKL